MGQMCDVPEHDILFLHTLIIFIVPELASGSEAPGNIFTCVRPTNRHVMVDKPVPFAIIFQWRIPRAGQDQDSMSIQLIANKPASVGLRNFDIISLVRILAPAGAPTAIWSSIVMDKYLIHAVSVDVEVKSPIGVMYMVGIAREPPALDDRPDFAVFRQMPRLINMILTDPSIHTEFQPFDVLLGRAFDADFLITAIHDRHKILPAQTILKRAATPAFSTRSKPGKRIPPDHLSHVFHSDDRHTGLGKDRLIRIGDIAKS